MLITGYMKEASFTTSEHRQNSSPCETVFAWNDQTSFVPDPGAADQEIPKLKVLKFLFPNACYTPCKGSCQLKCWDVGWTPLPKYHIISCQRRYSHLPRNHCDKVQYLLGFLFFVPKNTSFMLRKDCINMSHQSKLKHTFEDLLVFFTKDPLGEVILNHFGRYVFFNGFSKVGSMKLIFLVWN